MVEGPGSMMPDASIVVEWDNVALAGAPRALVTLARVAHHGGAGLWAIVRHRRKVGLSLAGVPVALGICWVYYGLCFAGEAATLPGVGAIRRVRV
jgi:hypothetical protein